MMMMVIEMMMVIMMVVVNGAGQNSFKYHGLMAKITSMYR